jgi:ketosteroid isomerase-like protein
MNNQLAPLAAEREFFTALLKGDVKTLDKVLTDDFTLVDVMRGAEITKKVLLAAVESGQLKFELIAPADSHVRSYQATAVVNGWTQMNGLAGGSPFVTKSRYTHVYVKQQGGWRLVAAQGTPILEEQVCPRPLTASREAIGKVS